MSKGLPWAGGFGSAPSARKFYAPEAPGHTVSPQPVELRDEKIPESTSPGPSGHSNEISSRQGNKRGPLQSTTSEMHESLNGSWPTSSIKPRLMR